MDKNKKGVLALLGIGALVGGIVALTRKPGGGGGQDTSLQLVIIPAQTRFGRSVAAIAPGTLLAGSNGNVATVSITNGTVYAGTLVPAPYSFHVRVSITVHTVTPDIPELVLDKNDIVQFAPGETKTISWAFNVPLNAATPYAGLARLMTGDDLTLIVSAVANGTVLGSAVTPGGTITF